MCEVVRMTGRSEWFGRQSLSLVTSSPIRVSELQELGGLVLEEPVAEAAVFPFGKVLFGDGAIVEIGGEDRFDFRERVEPGKDGFGGNTVVEFEVELFAEVVRETSDFADARSSVHSIYDL
jgi:hypothetical protein